MNQQEELARELFIADNFKQPRDQSLVDWEWFTTTPRFAVRVEHYKTMSAGVIAAGYSKLRTITTVEELDKLPVGSVVIDGHGDVCERSTSGWTGIIKERLMDTWLLTGAEDLPLDCIVLHEGVAS